MQILIAGGTGFVGRHLCAELLDRDLSVVAMSRDPDPTAVPEGVTLRQGDITEYAGLEEALQDIDVVVNLVALSPLYRPRNGEGMHEQVHVQGTRNLVRAMDATNVDRLIHMSALGADPDGPTAYLRAKGRAEGIVRSADLDETVVRPTVIFGTGAEFVPFVKSVTTPYLTGLPGGGRMRFQPIWVGDMVGVLADAIEDEQHIGAAYNIGGQEVHSLADVTRMIYRAEDRSVKILPVPLALAGIGLTIAGPLPRIPFGRDQYRSLRLDNTVESNDITVFGRSAADLRTLEAYLQESAPEE